MIWADRVAVVFALICAVVVLLNTDPGHAFNVSTVLVLTLWAALRAVDFIAMGSVRRSSRRPQ